MSITARLLRLLHQAWPVLLGQWAIMAYAVIDTIMTGRASPQDLAAMALGAAVYSSVFVTLMGCMNALNPLVAHAWGAARPREAGQIASQGLWLALLFAVPGMMLLLWPGWWQLLSGPLEPEVARKAEGYLAALALALPFALMFRAIYAVNTAISKPRVIMTISLAGLAMKVLLNWPLIHGWGDWLPALGTIGAGIATALVNVFSVGLGLIIMRRDRSNATLELGLRRPDIARLRALLALALPMGASYLIEATSFSFMALLVAREGTAVTGAHQVIANLAGFLYMIPLALAIAGGTAVAQQLGAGHPAEARRQGLAALALSLIMAVLAAGVLVLFARPLTTLYTADAQVAATVLALMPLLVLFHLVDGVQCVAGFLLRAHRRAVLPLVVHGTCLWGVGLAGGWWLGFVAPATARAWLDWLPGSAPAGAASLWLMASLGMAAAASLLIPAWLMVSRLTIESATEVHSRNR